MDPHPNTESELHEIYGGDWENECSTVDFLAHMPGSNICRELKPEEEDSEDTWRVFWYPNSDEPIEEIIKSIFLEYASYFNDSEYVHVLGQLWAANKNGRGGLSTSEQPFGVYGLCNGVCRYRYRCMTITRESQLEIPIVRRALADRRIQYCPDITLHNGRVFPLKEFAIWSGFGEYLAIPLLKPESDHHCIGVIEFLFGIHDHIRFRDLIAIPEKFGLTVSTTPNSHVKDMAQRQQEWDRAMIGATSLEDLLDGVRKELKLALVQLWVPCNCSIPEPHLLCLATSVDELHLDHRFYMENKESFAQVYFATSGDLSCIGRAYSLNTTSFCRYIRGLEISEHHTALLTRSTHAKACFAIPMHLIYPHFPPSFILQLFLPSLPYFMDCENSEGAALLKTLLSTLLVTLTHKLSTQNISFARTQAQQFCLENSDPYYHYSIFQNFNVRRGEEALAGNNTSVHNHETLEQQFPSPDQDPPPSFGANDHNTAQDIMPELLLLPSLDQSPTSEAAHNHHCNTHDIMPEPLQFPSADALADPPPTSEANHHNHTQVTQPKANTCTNSSGNRKRKITYDMIKPCLHRLSLDEAAQHLRVSKSTLKRRWSEFKEGRWPTPKSDKLPPPRVSTKSAEIGCSRNNNNNNNVVGEKVADTANARRKSIAMGDDGIDQSDTVTFKATYGGDTAKIKFGNNSGIAQLRKELGEIFEIERFRIKYKDEDGDWILMSRDQDLHMCITTFKTSGKNIMELSISLVT